MLARLASRSSFVWFLVVGAAVAIALAIVVASSPNTTLAPAKRSAIPSIGRCNTKPVVARVPATDCMAWVSLDVAKPTRVCSEDEQIQLLAAYLQLDLPRGMKPYHAATRIRTIPIWCRANLPAVGRTFVRASVQAMGMRDYPAAEQFVSLAALYGDPFTDIPREVRKALERERKAICKARHDSRIAR
jgi:hypothetical protein